MAERITPMPYTVQALQRQKAEAVDLLASSPLLLREYKEWRSATFRALKQILDTFPDEVNYFEQDVERADGRDLDEGQMDASLRTGIRILDTVLSECDDGEINKPHPSLSSDLLFLVHGNDPFYEQVGKFLQELKINPLLLGKDATWGYSNLQVLEQHPQVRYAVVVLAHDDVGAQIANLPFFRARAGQDVVFDLGYVIGKLGRDCVWIIAKGPLELPRNLAGIKTISGDADWNSKLKRELQAIGLI